MPILVAAIVLGIVVARINEDLARAPWLRWSRLLFAAGAIPVALGGAALGGLLFAALGGNWPLLLLLLVATVPFWLGPRRIVEILLGGGPRRRFLYLLMWERALLHQEPPGLEPPALWHYQERMAELDGWTDPQTQPYARLLAARTREWRSAAHGSPVERVRREIELAHWLAPDVADPASTRRWQLYAAYWAAIADSSLLERRSLLASSLKAFRDPPTAPFLDLVIGSLDKPLAAWPWDSIEAAGRSIWPDGYVLMRADSHAEIVMPHLPVPLLGPDWDRSSPPLRPPS